MSLSGSFSLGYFSGRTASVVAGTVPEVWDCAIGGRTYMIDRKIGAWGEQSIPPTRTQADSSNEPGEATRNPDDLWPRSQTSWHKGAGQTYLDRPESERERFRSSKGIMVFDKWKIHLLQGTDDKQSSANTNLRLMPAGSRLYLVDGTDMTYTTDITAATPTWNACTGESGNSILSIASDGFTIWITDGANVLSSNTGTAAFSAFSTEDIDVLGYAKGRLMGFEDGEVFYWNGTAFTSLYVQPSGANFTCVGFAEGPSAIYMGGYAGDKSLIYRIDILTTGVGLDQPVVAGELPDGERLYGINSYLGAILLGTSKGLRYCTTDSNGNLTIGGLVSIGTPVRCFEGQGEFIWFGWTNYDGTSTGLGRCDLRTFTDPALLLPAYASDLMVTTQGNVLDVVTFNDLRVFAISGVGIYAEDSSILVASGTIDSGLITFDLPSNKTAISLEVRYDAQTFAGTHTAYIATNGSSTFTSIGSHDDSSASGNAGDSFFLNGEVAETFEVREMLARDGTNTNTGPTITRHTLLAEPSSSHTAEVQVPLLLEESVINGVGQENQIDVLTERQQIREWQRTSELLSYQEGHETLAVIIKDYRWLPRAYTDDLRTGPGGTLILSLKVLP